jgi:hypothetical protein
VDALSQARQGARSRLTERTPAIDAANERAGLHDDVSATRHRSIWSCFRPGGSARALVVDQLPTLKNDEPDVFGVVNEAYRESRRPSYVSQATAACSE